MICCVIAASLGAPISALLVRAIYGGRRKALRAERATHRIES